MSSTTTDLKARVQDLIDHITQGKILEAMDEFYASDVEMGENTAPMTKGLAANIEREKQFLSTVKEWHSTTIDAVAVNEETGAAFIEYGFEFTNTDGKSVVYQQTSAQRWSNGKIARERFYYGS